MSQLRLNVVERLLDIVLVSSGLSGQTIRSRLPSEWFEDPQILLILLEVVPEAINFNNLDYSNKQLLLEILTHPKIHLPNSSIWRLVSNLSAQTSNYDTELLQALFDRYPNYGYYWYHLLGQEPGAIKLALVYNPGLYQVLNPNLTSRQDIKDTAFDAYLAKSLEYWEKEAYDLDMDDEIMVMDPCQFLRSLTPNVARQAQAILAGYDCFPHTLAIDQEMWRLQNADNLTHRRGRAGRPFG